MIRTTYIGKAVMLVLLTASASATAEAGKQHWFYDNMDGYSAGTVFDTAPPRRTTNFRAGQPEDDRMRPYRGPRAFFRRGLRQRWREYGAYEPQAEDYPPYPPGEEDALVDAPRWRRGAPTPPPRDEGEGYDEPFPAPQSDMSVESVERAPLPEYTPRQPERGVAGRELRARPKPEQKRQRQARKETAPRQRPSASVSGGKGISCESGKSVLKGFGFSRVEPVSCSGKFFSYRAWRDGKPFSVSLKATTGELTKVRREKKTAGAPGSS